MDLTEYVDALRHSLTTAAAAGGEQARETARLLAEAVDPAVRLAVMDALSAMAAEVTDALENTLVEIRMRGREPEVVVETAEHPASAESSVQGEDDVPDDGSVSRISLRLPEAIKARAEAAAAADGTSLNAWLVRAVSDALRGSQSSASGRSRASGRRYTGFARS
jgi:hypothetical protein